MLKEQKSGEVRILGRVVGRELSKIELDEVSGGASSLPKWQQQYKTLSAGTDNHAGTCTDEKDCD